MALEIKKSNFSSLVGILLALSVVGIFLIKVFIFEDCFAFDTNDDTNHTFVNLKASQDILKQGELPNINLYNNFGTPLVGDALTFPFSIQSLTYWVFPNYLAMTINRGIIVFLTVLLVFLFLNQSLSILSSMIGSLVVIFSPGVFWNMAHHHYQMTLLGFVTLLLVQNCYEKLKPIWFLLLLWFLYIVYFLSVSIQLVAISTPFLLLYLFLKFKRQALPYWILNSIAFIAAAVFMLPQLRLFFEYIAGSTRAHWSPYTGILTTVREQTLALFFPAGEWMHFGVNGHFSIVTYFSFPILLFIALGLLISFFDRKRNWGLFFQIIILGVIPAVGGYYLQFHGQNLNFVKSVDSTRVWWFSNLFLALALGQFIDVKKEILELKSIRILFLTLSILITLSTIVLDRIFPELKDISILHLLIIGGTALVLLQLFYSKAKPSMAGRISSGIVLILSLIPTLTHVLALNMHSCEIGNHHFSYADKATFQPHELLGAMSPYSRLASEENAGLGHDFKAIFGNVLGSNARAIVSSQEFSKILLNEKLIKLDDNYFFSSPWQIDKLNELGIRYLLLEKENHELKNLGWSFVLSKNKEKWLYENPEKPTLAHFVEGATNQYLQNVQIVPNGIRLQTPNEEKEKKLIISFFNWKRWEATVDDKKVPINSSPLGMVQIQIPPGTHQVFLHYNGLSMKDLFLFFLISGFILFISYFYLIRNKIERKGTLYAKI